MGGHGALNILPEKSWNVYNLDNRLKVDNDKDRAQAEAWRERQALKALALERVLQDLKRRRADRHARAATRAPLKHSCRDQKFIKEVELQPL